MTDAAGIQDEQVIGTARAACVTTACAHCGTPCPGGLFGVGEHSFCCAGCRTVFELLFENGLGSFYQLSERAGVRVSSRPSGRELDYLDAPEVRSQLVDFTDERTTRVTFRIPAIHCIACVWLLENLHRLNAAVDRTQVNFPRKEVSIQFQTGLLKLGALVELLQSLGYPPELNLADAGKAAPQKFDRKLWLQIGVAGFAFGNIMLLSLAGYFGLDSASGPAFTRLTGWISLALSLPVLAFSAQDYWRSAWISLRQRRLNIEVPIALGLVAFLGQSVWEFLSGHGEGCFDSLTGFVFFLLLGRLFQQKTYDRLSFERDYRSFFPLSVTRRRRGQDERVGLAQVAVADHLIIRNAELIPADALLVDGPALIDYSFVTGESDPSPQLSGARLFAGGRQVGGAIEVEIVKPVSQSHLTSLWNQDAFRKEGPQSFQSLTNRLSPWFTSALLAVALCAAIYWWMSAPSLALKAFAAVLIVACPCAGVLAAPFALGTAQRMLATRQVFVKSTHVLETLARVDTVVFDKTGTLTSTSDTRVQFHGEPLAYEESRWLYSMTRQSTHPHALRIGEILAGDHFPEAVRTFIETPGCGMEGQVCGHEIWMGSAAWLTSRGAHAEDDTGNESSIVGGSAVHVAIDGRHRGCFSLEHALRPEIGRLVKQIKGRCSMVLLSGDTPRERSRFEAIFGGHMVMHFNQSPLDKLHHVRSLQRAGATVMMVGDGLNDAGALKQSDVGVAVADDVHAFSPASDVILHASQVPSLGAVMDYARAAVNVVRICLLVSIAYNLPGIAIAAMGWLSPIVCAVLMPLSSISVVGLAGGLAVWSAGRTLKGAAR